MEFLLKKAGFMCMLSGYSFNSFKSQTQAVGLSFLESSFGVFHFPHLYYFFWNPFPNLFAFVSTNSAYFCSAVWNSRILFVVFLQHKQFPFNACSTLLFTWDWNKACKLILCHLEVDWSSEKETAKVAGKVDLEDLVVLSIWNFKYSIWPSALRKDSWS